MHNGATYLWTFTMADQTHDRAEVVERWHAFARRLGARWPELAWLRALERHQSGAIHVHAALSRRVPHEVIAELWGHGHVWVSPVQRGRGIGRRERARMVARYVAKYIAKELADAPPGAHGYEVAQGFAPTVVRARAFTKRAALAIAWRLAGRQDPTYVSESVDWADYRGPPALALAWS